MGVQTKTMARKVMKIKRNIWNRCDVCGKFISCKDFLCHKALRVIESVDSCYSTESYITLCKTHNTKHEPDGS